MSRRAESPPAPVPPGSSPQPKTHPFPDLPDSHNLVGHTRRPLQQPAITRKRLPSHRPWPLRAWKASSAVSGRPPSTTRNVSDPCDLLPRKPKPREPANNLASASPVANKDELERGRCEAVRKSTSNNPPQHILLAYIVVTSP